MSATVLASIASWRSVSPLSLSFTGLLLLTSCASRQPAPSTKSTQPAPAATASIVPVRLAPDEILQKAAAIASAPLDGDGWQPLFDGKSLSGWHGTPFSGRGEIECRFNSLVLNMGDPFTGVNWTNEFPKTDYEIALDAMRVMGSDFFCGLTVPVGESFCTLIVGGWGGSVLGISSIDSMDASENETTKFMNFEKGRWYRIRLRITEGRIEGWIDKEKLVDVVTTGKRIALRAGEIEASKPFGIAAWQSTAALREIKLRHVKTPADPPKR